ncbi:twin-arginine translocation signal domain-containing protein [Nocardioides sp. CN2-186]|uniref:twin-arginine translocation signal domain-containing protein n=1 Tax=Nocardioides tweenelious TaxID=3156607 RepID=UPI0032B55BE0
MSDTSRRKFLAAAGVGATAGTIALTTGMANAAGARRNADSAQETVLAIVDHTSSELRLLVGEREVVVDDRDLVNRILNAAGGR